MRQCREEYSANGSSMNLLLTSIGKRIELIEHLKSRFRVIGADASGLNAAKRFVDSFYHIPKCHEDGYVDALLSICEREAVLLLVPLAIWMRGRNIGLRFWTGQGRGLKRSV